MAEAGQLKTSGTVTNAPGASVSGGDGTPLNIDTLPLPVRTVAVTETICALDAGPLPALVRVMGNSTVDRVSVCGARIATAIAGVSGVKFATIVSGLVTVTWSGLTEVVGTLPLKFAKT